MAAIVVTLSLSEIMQAAVCGSIRRVTAIKENMRKKVPEAPEDWNTDIESAAAEIAVAKAFGKYWDSSNRTFKAPDLADIQVRSTLHRNGHLIVREHDDDWHYYALVICDRPRYSVVGYIDGKTAKQMKYWRKDSWWVPQEDLLPPENMLDGGSAPH